MCDNTNNSTQSIADYLAQLLKDRKQLAAFPNVFIHVERLLDEGMCFFASFINISSPFCCFCLRCIFSKGYCEIVARRT